MQSIILKRIINTTVWIVSGIVVLIVRYSATQGGTNLVYEAIGGGMIIYGAGRLVWTIIKTPSASPPSV